MKKSKYLIIGFMFLILSGAVIYSSKLTVLFFPTQEMELSRELEYGALKKEFLIIQEITVTKEYLTAVELGMVSWGMPYLNENTLMVLDTNYQTLYMKSFTNENLDSPQYKFFKFPEKIHVGKGKKVMICLIRETFGEPGCQWRCDWNIKKFRAGSPVSRQFMHADI
jgi:hypothetical protein